MAFQPSLRRRRLSGQSARLSQPAPWSAGVGASALVLNQNGSAITASATANTPGAWVQFIANNAIAAADTINSLHIQAIGNNQVNGTDNSFMIDIGTGAAGSEVVVAEGIAVGPGANSGGAGANLQIPIRIPGATRVAMRARAAVGSRIFVVPNLLASGAGAVSPFADRLPLTLDTIGSNPATSSGTAMTGASGTWTELTASTTKDYQALVLVPSGPGNFTGATTTQFRLDLGIGAAGAEQAVAYCNAFYNANGVVFPNIMTSATAIYGGFIPAGTRISVRHNQAANPSRVCACVIGVPYV